MTKAQINPNTQGTCAAWDLSFGHSLGLGHWSLGIIRRWIGSRGLIPPSTAAPNAFGAATTGLAPGSVGFRRLASDTTESTPWNQASMAVMGWPLPLLVT